MYYSKLEKNKYLIRLERGEEINTLVKDFCEKEGINNAVFWGLGSIENPVLAHYRVDRKKYTEKEVKGIFEITNITGNIAVFEDKPLLHTHVTISNEEMQAFGGHLVRGLVSATAEIYVVKLNSKLQKKHNDEIGLKLWELPEEM